MIKELDTDGDGDVDIDEFLVLIAPSLLSRELDGTALTMEQQQSIKAGPYCLPIIEPSSSLPMILDQPTVCLVADSSIQGGGFLCGWFSKLRKAGLFPLWSGVISGADAEELTNAWETYAPDCTVAYGVLHGVPPSL